MKVKMNECINEEWLIGEEAVTIYPKNSKARDFWMLGNVAPCLDWIPAHSISSLDYFHNMK